MIKKKLPRLFTFPIADTTLFVYVEDLTYTEEYQANGNMITRTMFLKYFPTIISPGLQLNQLNELFKAVNIDDLAKKDRTEFENKTQKNPCYEYFYIDIDKEIVTLTFGTNTNTDYVDTSKTSDDEEDDVSGCEFASIWVFKFEEKKLHFVKKMDAG